MNPFMSDQKWVCGQCGEIQKDSRLLDYCEALDCCGGKGGQIYALQIPEDLWDEWGWLICDYEERVAHLERLCLQVRACERRNTESQVSMLGRLGDFEIPRMRAKILQMKRRGLERIDYTMVPNSRDLDEIECSLWRHCSDFAQRNIREGLERSTAPVNSPMEVLK